MRSFIALAVLYAAFAAATPLPQVSPIPADLGAIVDAVLDSLDRRQISGIPDAGTGLAPTRTTVDQAVDSTVGDAAPGRRQLGGVVQGLGSDLDGIVILPSGVPLLGDLALRQLPGGPDLLIGVDTLANDLLDNPNIDVLRSRSTGDLALRQSLEGVVVDTSSIVNDIENLGENALDRRQSTEPSLTDVDALVNDVLDNLGVNALDRRQSPEPSLTDVDALVDDVLDNLGVNALDRRQSPEPSLTDVDALVDDVLDNLGVNAL